MTDMRYNILSKWIETTTFVPMDERCNGWVAINKGTGVAVVNGVPLNPPTAPNLSGESTGATGNAGEIFAGTMNVQFVPGAIKNLVLIVQKIYF